MFICGTVKCKVFSNKTQQAKNSVPIEVSKFFASVYGLKLYFELVGLFFTLEKY